MFYGLLPDEAKHIAEKANIPIFRIASRIQQVFAFAEGEK